MWRRCLATFLCSAVLQWSGVCPQFTFTSLSTLAKTLEKFKQLSKHADYYFTGKSLKGIDIPVLLITKDARERSLVGIPKICILPGASLKETYSRNVVLKMALRLVEQTSQLYSSILSEFALHILISIGTPHDLRDFNGMFDYFPSIFVESEPPAYTLAAAEWLVKTRCLMTIIFGGYGRGIAIPFFSDPADISAFNAAGHVIRDRIELEERMKKNLNPEVKDYDADYKPPEDDGVDIPEIPIEYPPGASFLTPADRDRTRRSSASFRFDGDGRRMLSSETTEDKKRGWVWPPRDQGGGESKRRVLNRRAPKIRKKDKEKEKRERERKERERKERERKEREKKEKEKQAGIELVKPCIKDQRQHPLPPFIAPDHDDLVYLAGKFSDAIQTITYPQCPLDSRAVCLPENSTIFTGRTWRYAAGALADFAYMKGGTLPITVFVYCSSITTGFEIPNDVFSQIMDGVTSIILSSRYGVRGIVKTTKGVPLAGVFYTVVGREQIVMTTSDQGEFARLLTGKHIIQFRKEGYQLVNHVVVVQQSEVVQFNITMLGVNERLPDQNQDQPTSSGSTLALTVAPVVAGLLSYAVNVVIVRRDD